MAEDPALRKASQFLRGWHKDAKRRAAKAVRKNGLAKLPRQTCIVCSAVFDFAIIKGDAPIHGTICRDCKGKLAEGYTACVSMKMFAFVRSPHIKEMAGQIIKVSEENMEKIKAQMIEQQPKPKDVSEN